MSRKQNSEATFAYIVIATMKKYWMGCVSITTRIWQRKWNGLKNLEVTT